MSKPEKEEKADKKIDLNDEADQLYAAEDVEAEGPADAAVEDPAEEGDLFDAAEEEVPYRALALDVEEDADLFDKDEEEVSAEVLAARAAAISEAEEAFLRSNEGIHARPDDEAKRSEAGGGNRKKET